jgi:hypothetical protein
MKNTYQKLSDGSWGAWIDCGYGRSAIAKPVVGDTVSIRTKAGEVHTRQISGIVKNCASGVVVSLTQDEQVAAKAKARYEAKKSEATPNGRASRSNAPCPLCGTWCYGDCTAN